MHVCVVGIGFARERVFALVALVLCLLPANARADEGQGSTVTEIGAKAAMGGTSLRTSADDAMVGVEASATVGYAFGVYATLWRFRWLRLQTELLYSSRQSTLRQVPDGMTADYSLGYLELPVLARLDIPVGRYEPFIALGASPGILVNAEHGSGYELDGVLRPWDVGLVAAIGSAVVVNRRWQVTLEARYTHGVTDAFARTSRENRGLLFTVGMGYRTSLRPERAEDLLDGEELETDYDRETMPELPPLIGGPSGELDRWVAIAGMLPCYREHPRVVSWIRGLPGDREMVDWTYVREVHGDSVTLRQLDLVVAEGHPVALAQCLSGALDGMSWPRSSRLTGALPLERLESNDESFRLVLRASVLRRLLQGVGY